MIVLYVLGYFYRNKQNSYAALDVWVVASGGGGGFGDYITNIHNIKSNVLYFKGTSISHNFSYGCLKMRICPVY